MQPAGKRVVFFHDFTYMSPSHRMYIWKRCISAMRRSRGGGGQGDRTMQYWSGSPKNHKAAKPAFNNGPSTAPQRNSNLKAFRWRADDGPKLAVFGPTHQLKKTTTKKNVVIRSGSAHVRGKPNCSFAPVTGVIGQNLLHAVNKLKSQEAGHIFSNSGTNQTFNIFPMKKTPHGSFISGCIH